MLSTKNVKEKKWFVYLKIYIGMLIAYLMIMGILYYAGGEQFKIRTSDNLIEKFPADNLVGDMVVGRYAGQTWYNEIINLNQIGVLASNYNKELKGNLVLELWNEDSKSLVTRKVIEPNEIRLNEYIYLELTGDEELHKTILTLKVYSENGIAGEAATILYNSNEEIKGGEFVLDGNHVNGSLCITTFGIEEVWAGNHYLQLIGIGCLLWSLFYLLSVWRKEKGKREVLFSTCYAIKKYWFLIKQLVSRDFKVRYKRSMLGMMWSILNPVLMMLVQYMVFSRLFKGGIENIALYILSGSVIFNFFTEAVNQALGSIVYSASLITKVYVPKYIYPISKVLSSTVNLFISMLPLLVVMILTGEEFTKALLALPFLIICVLVFCMGIGMLLATSMVFFRDTQFLWGIFSLLWMYMTPLFYPESIMEQSLHWIFDINPMYYYVNFIRDITLHGVSPDPREYLICILFAMGSFCVGGYIFKKNQNKFILNI